MLKNCMWLFYYFNFERKFVNLLKRNINFNKNETKSKMESPKHSFRETNLKLRLI